MMKRRSSVIPPILLLLIVSFQFLEEASSFAPSSATRRTLLPQKQQKTTHIPLIFHTSQTSPNTSKSSSSLYFRHLEEPRINGAVAKHQISLSTNQGIAFGCLLAWTSGMINGATLMGLWSQSQGTAALTGTYTKSALYLAQADWVQCTYYFKCLLAWMSGSTLVGLLIPEPSAFEVKYPKGLALSLAMGAASLSVAGIYGGIALKSQTFVLLCLLANGIQDAVSSIMTGNLCRTTHLTGITCDIGTYLGQMVRKRSTKDVNKVKMRAFPLLALSFWIGAFMSYPLGTLFGARYLLGVAGAYLGIAASIGIYFLRHRLGW